MKPEEDSFQLLGVTRSKAKMYEYAVPSEHHINVVQDPAYLFRLTIGILGDVSASIISSYKNDTLLDDYREQLQFAAHFFDSYLNSRLDHENRYYLLLLGAASYYLCGLPGSALVLADSLDSECPNLGGAYLENFLTWLVRGKFSQPLTVPSQLYGELINSISRQLVDYFGLISNENNLRENLNRLRNETYQFGSPRNLLFTDVSIALIEKRLENSARNALPVYSGLTADQWSEALQKESFVRELWPAQHLLGKRGILQGRSAVIQMPTSAGKTKATEIIIRSSFLSNRASIAIVVAPFRALCQEIKSSLTVAFADESVYIDDPSDVFQIDFDVAEFLGLGLRRKILIVTPEKLTYILRQSPELADSVGLILYDEGHQFDNGTRGITYELLLSSLRKLIPQTTQSILISAVISNASSINEWLNGNDSEVITGNHLLPTYRTVAFTSWQDQLGRLQFVDEQNPDEKKFYVPRIIEQQRLELKGRERKERFFPNRKDGKSIAAYLGIKLVSNGSVAIFCGEKGTVNTVCEEIVEAYTRNLQYQQPIIFSDETEVEKIHLIYEENLGTEYAATQSAKIGIFAHSGNTPHGIRLSTEYAMQKGLIKFVICTSTLAQGVNLPIRYLIVTSIYQAGQKIKVRDFHNLIGRAGRAGMYTEGSVIFADPIVYDGRNNFKDRWRWQQIRDTLDPQKSEPCASTLLSIFEPWNSNDRSRTSAMNLSEFILAYINGEQALMDYCRGIVDNRFFVFQDLWRQIEYKARILASVESYLMAYWGEANEELKEDAVTNLAESTLAYFLSNDEQKHQITELFNSLAANILQKVPEQAKRMVYGKTLYGVNDSLEIEGWVLENLTVLEEAISSEKLLSILWPVLYSNIRNKIFTRFETEEHLNVLTIAWMNGEPYYQIFERLNELDARITAGTQRRRLKLEHVIEVCDNALSYDGTLVIGAINEFILSNNGKEDSDLSERVSLFQKRLKYGLPNQTDIAIYELGFSDRTLAMSLSALIEFPNSYKQNMIRNLQQHYDTVMNLLNRYPTYFTSVIENLTQNPSNM